MIKYSDKLNRLEEIKSLLEDKDIEIEKSFELYKESIVIFKELKEFLDNSKKEFMELEKFE